MHQTPDPGSSLNTGKLHVQRRALGSANRNTDTSSAPYANPENTVSSGHGARQQSSAAARPGKAPRRLGTASCQLWAQGLGDASHVPTIEMFIRIYWCFEYKLYCNYYCHYKFYYKDGLEVSGAFAPQRLIPSSWGSASDPRMAIHKFFSCCSCTVRSWPQPPHQQAPANRVPTSLLAAPTQRRLRRWQRACNFLNFSLKPPAQIQQYFS